MKVNGEDHSPAEAVTVFELIESFHLNPSLVAVELNGEICMRDEWKKTALKEEDKVEILRFVGGG